MIQSTLKRKNPTTDGGSKYNLNQFQATGATNVGCFCCYAFFCRRCLVGDLLQKSVGMSWLMGCCLGDLYLARNIIRYHYRIRPLTGSECSDECFTPCCIDRCLKCCIPCFGLVKCMAEATLLAQMKEHIDKVEEGRESKLTLLYCFINCNYHSF